MLDGRLELTSLELDVAQGEGTQGEIVQILFADGRSPHLVRHRFRGKKISRDQVHPEKPPDHAQLNLEMRTGVVQHAC